ncbi:GDNF-inducible zinc finger 1 [Schistosoma japonicum]|nr:GDNF-inducible zinc finger 1 [Schistosoma japonicum]
MEIGPNLCVWSIQSGIDHELNSMKNLSPIVQQKNSFAYNRSNGVVLELESDSETEKQSSTDNSDFQNLHYFHDKINSNNKDYTCGFCGFDFDTAEQVEEHVLFKHSDNLITSNSSKIKPMNTSLPSDLFPFYKDSVNSLKNDHKLSVDPSENSSSNIVAEQSKLIGNDQDFPPFTITNPLITDCPLCDRTFVGRRSLNIHLNKTHSIKENNNNSSGTDNSNSVINNTDGKQLKSICSTKLTRFAYSRSLRNLNGNNNNNNNNNSNNDNNDSSNKTTSEITKPVGEKFLSKIAVRPPILPRPSRMNSSITSSSLSKTNIENKNLQNNESFSQDLLASKNNEVEDLNPQKPRRTVYAVSPPLSTEQSK